MLVTTRLASALCTFTFLAHKNFTARFRKIMLLDLLILGVLLTNGAGRGPQLIYGHAPPSIGPLHSSRNRTRSSNHEKSEGTKADER
jgi:hypothetical protein